MIEQQLSWMLEGSLLWSDLLFVVPGWDQQNCGVGQGQAGGPLAPGHEVLGAAVSGGMVMA